MKRWSTFLAQHAPGQRPLGLRLAVTAAGLLVFGCVVPWLLVLLARAVQPGQVWPPVCAVPVALVGFGLAVWTVAAQVGSGRGTPVPLVPTQRLLTDGPYRLCRNPMVSGAFLAYLGIVPAAAGALGSLVALSAIAAIGLLYHKAVEEPELAMRFGADYEAYRARTPFLPTPGSLWRWLRPKRG